LLTPPKNKLHALAFLEIGLFEIGFVAVILLLLFGVLNYFNILSVSEVFPKQLGWLPRKEVSSGTSQTKLASQGEALRGSGEKTAPSPANFTPTTFQYDTEKAKTLLTQYIKDTIKPSLLPANIEIKQATINSKIENSSLFFASFNIQNASTAAVFRYDKTVNSTNSLSLSLNLKNLSQFTDTTTLANFLLSTYFSTPLILSDPNCRMVSESVFCENFQTTSDGKKGYGMTIIGTPPKSINNIFTCLIPKESADYASAKSCISF